MIGRSGPAFLSDERHLVVGALSWGPLLAPRKAWVAYVMGDKAGVLAALSALDAFDAELSGDPLRRDAARLRTLVLQREEGVR